MRWQQTIVDLPFVCGKATHDRRFPRKPYKGKCPDCGTAVIDQSDLAASFEVRS